MHVNIHVDTHACVEIYARCKINLFLPVTMGIEAVSISHHICEIQ